MTFVTLIQEAWMREDGSIGGKNSETGNSRRREASATILQSAVRLRGLSGCR
jgi:hypothetical protein